MQALVLPGIRRFGPAIVLFSILLGPITALSISGRTPSLFWCDILLVSFLILEACLAATREPSSELRIPFLGPFLVYLALALISTLWAIDILATIAAFKLRLMALVAFCYIALWHRRFGDLHRSARWFTAFGGLLGLQIIWNFERALRGDFPGPNVELLSIKDLARTALGRSNYLASFLIVVLPIVVALLYGQRSLLRRLIVATVAVACVAALLITQSRGGILSLALGLLAAMVIGLVGSRGARSTVRLRGGGVVLIVVALVLAGAVALVPGDALQDFGVRADDLVEQWSQGDWGGNRQEIWAAALEHLTDHPLLGMGLGNQQVERFALGMGETTHNLYLDTLLELGLLGALALGGLLAAAGHRLYRAWQSEADPQMRSVRLALLTALLIGLVNAFQEPSFWGEQYSIVFWFLVGLGCAPSLRSDPEETTCGEAICHHRDVQLRS